MNILQKREENRHFGEISKELHISKEEITLCLESTNPVSSIEENLYSNNKTDQKISILESLSTNKDEESLIINKITIKNLIDKLNSRDKQIILLRYFKDKTQTEISKILGISQVQVSRIEKRILEQMKKELA